MRFAFVKATEGRSWEDPYFDLNWKLLKQAKLARGAYHFYRPNRDATQQANFYASTVELEPGDLPPVLDVEKTDGRSPEIIRAGVKTWLRLVGRRYGVRPILYTNHDFYIKYFAGHFDEYPLWLAHYEVRQPRVHADRWTFWQHSDEALVPGIRGFVDGNVFGGSERAFQGLLVGAPEVVVPVKAKPKSPPRKAKAPGRKKKSKHRK
jgi:lysozyme